MSESYSGCRGPSSSASGSSGFSGAPGAGGPLQCVGNQPGAGCSACASASGAGVQPSNRRVQIRAKVLYGSGKAIASLKAQEKAARH